MAPAAHCAVCATQHTSKTHPKSPRQASKLMLDLLRQMPGQGRIPIYCDHSMIRAQGLCAWCIYRVKKRPAAQAKSLTRQGGGTGWNPEVGPAPVTLLCSQPGELWGSQLNFKRKSQAQLNGFLSWAHHVYTTAYESHSALQLYNGTQGSLKQELLGVRSGCVKRIRRVEGLVGVLSCRNSSKTTRVSPSHHV